MLGGEPGEAALEGGAGDAEVGTAGADELEDGGC